MKKENIKNNTIAGLALALSITASGWVISYENTKVLQEVMAEQEDNNKKLSIEIANLDDVIAKKETDLNATKMVIDEQKIQINEQATKISEQERKETLLRAEVTKLKEENKKVYPTSKISRGASNTPSNAQYSLTVNASAYGSDCYGCSGVTATGYNVRNTIYYNGMRIVATDPNVIPLYSILEIEGFSERFIALDTGGRIKGRKIDILMSSESVTGAFGRKSLKVNVIRKGR